MLRQILLNILETVWPMLTIIFTILITFRAVYLYKNNIKFVFYKDMICLLFVFYVICLFQTVTFQDVGWSTSNFIPFKEIFRYNIFSSLFIRNVLGNVLMFIPYGLFIGYIFKEKKVFLPILLTLIISFVIESVQLWIGRVFDIDDIILNIVGGTTGFLLYKLFIDIKNHLPKFLQSNIFYNIVVFVIMILIILYLLNIISFGGL